MASWIVDNSQTRDGSATVSNSNGMAVLNETYRYIVQTDNKSTTRIEVLYGTPGLPRANQTVSAFGAAVCIGVDAFRRADNPLIWDVTATFSSEVEEGQDSQDPESDPTVWVPIYETKFERLQEVVTKDQSGTSIANSAGQPFQVGLTIGRFIPVWEFFQFEPATVTDEQIIDRNETVNNASFKGRAAKSLLLTILSSRVGFYYGARRRLTQYSLKYNDRLWTHKRLDVGTIYLATGQRKPYLDDDNRTVILGSLNGSGGKAAAGSPPATLEFDIYPSISFSFLRL
jgi:hypothetical protein